MTTLVLLPGLDGTGGLFTDFVAALGADFRSIVVSYPTDEALDYAGLEHFVRTLLPKNEPFFLLGESFSGPLAISIAATRPAGLQGVILCCSFSRNPRPWLSVFSGCLDFLPVAAIPIAILRFWLLGRFSTAQRCQALAEALSTVSPLVLRERVRAVLDVDMSAQLSAIATPMLYLHAMEDRLVPASAIQAIVSRLPGVRVVSLSAPHFLLQTVPFEAAEALRSFVAEIGDTESARK